MKFHYATYFPHAELKEDGTQRLRISVDMDALPFLSYMLTQISTFMTVATLAGNRLPDYMKSELMKAIEVTKEVISRVNSNNLQIHVDSLVASSQDLIERDKECLLNLEAVVAIEEAANRIEALTFE